MERFAGAHSAALSEYARMLRIAAFVVCVSGALILSGCPDDADPPAADSGVATHTDASSNADAAPNTDATIDGGVIDEDSGEPGEDGGETFPDAAPQADAAPSGECIEVSSIDGVIFGGMDLPRTIAPTSGAPSTLEPIVEADGSSPAGHTRVTAAGVSWHAQISSLATTYELTYEHFLIDPADGAVFVALEMQLSDSMGLKFYNADGTLFREYTPNGPPGADIIGRSRQSNFFIIKYDAQGAIQWSTRFGPNSNGDRAGRILSIGFVGDHIRVVGSVEDSSTIAFAPGTASAYEHTMPNAAAFWGELDKNTGDYVAGSARFIAATDSDSSSVLAGSGQFAHFGGETAMHAQLRKESQPVMETFTIGAEGQAPLTVTATRSTVAFVKIGAGGAPIFAATLSTPQLFGFGPDPRAVALGPNGELVAGGQFSSSEAVAIFRGTTGSTRISYVGRDSYLAAFAPDGALLWAKELFTADRNAISRIVVTDAIYVMGTNAAGERLPPLTVPANGYTLTRYSLATGDAEWIRVFTPSGVTQADAYSVWLKGNELVVPSAFTGVRIAGGTTEPVFTADPSNPLLGALYFSTNGDFLRCEAVATGVREFVTF